jgi:hypothetical protein
MKKKMGKKIIKSRLEPLSRVQGPGCPFEKGSKIKITLECCSVKRKKFSFFKILFRKSKKPFACKNIWIFRAPFLLASKCTRLKSARNSNSQLNKSLIKLFYLTLFWEFVMVSSYPHHSTILQPNNFIRDWKIRFFDLGSNHLDLTIL